MKCPYCGGEVPSLEIACPYCGRSNQSGIRFRDRVNQYRAANQELKKKIIAEHFIPMANRIANRVLIALAVLFVLFLIISSVLSVVMEKGSLTAALGIEPSDAAEQMEAYYTEGDYDELYRYMDTYELFDPEKYYTYGQIALISRYYQNWKSTRNDWIKKTGTGGYGNVWSLLYDTECVIGKGGVYEEPDPRNVAQLNAWRTEVEDFLVNYCALTPAEAATIYETGTAYNDHLEDKISERLAIPDPMEASTGTEDTENE